MTTQDREIRRALHAAADTVDASPPVLATLPTSAARRRQAAEHADEQNRTGRRTIARQDRRPQLVAVAIVAVVLVAGGAMLSNVLAQREVGMTASGAAAVHGSFRATVRYIGEPGIPEVTFDVVNGRVHARTGTPQRVPAAWRGWDGFGEAMPTLVDEQIIAGDTSYLHARAGQQGQARWYRYSGSHAEWQPRLDFEPPRAGELTMPVFREGTRGFRKVEDAEAAAQGLTRYSAQVSAADVDFLGWFSPTRGVVPPEDGDRMDIWVDGQGRVQHVREQSPDVSRYATVMRFDQFDALPAIPLPSGELPTAADAEAMVVEACGDPDFGDTLRDQVEAGLDGSDIVESYEIYEGSSPEAAHFDRRGMLFVAVVDLTDGPYADGGQLDEHLTRLSAHEPGSSPDSIEAAYVCGVGHEPYIKLHS